MARVRNWASVALLPLVAAIVSDRNLRGQHQQVLSSADSAHHTTALARDLDVFVLTQNMAQKSIDTTMWEHLIETVPGGDGPWGNLIQAADIVIAASQEKGVSLLSDPGNVKAVITLAAADKQNGAAAYYNFVVKARGLAVKFGQELRVSVKRTAMNIAERNVVKGEICAGKLKNKCVLYVSIPATAGENILIISGHLPMKGKEDGTAAGNLLWRLGESKRIAEFARVKAELVANNLWTARTTVIFTGDTNFRYDPVHEQLTTAMNAANGPFTGFVEGPPTHFTCRFGKKPTNVNLVNYLNCRTGDGPDYTITAANDAAYGNKYSWAVANPVRGADAVVDRSKATCWSIDHWRPMSRCDRAIVRPGTNVNVAFHSQTSFPLVPGSDHNAMLSNFVLHPTNGALRFAAAVDVNGPQAEEAKVAEDQDGARVAAPIALPVEGDDDDVQPDDEEGSDDAAPAGVAGENPGPPTL